MELGWGTGDPDRARTLVTELISLAPAGSAIAALGFSPPCTGRVVTWFKRPKNDGVVEDRPVTSVTPPEAVSLACCSPGRYWEEQPSSRCRSGGLHSRGGRSENGTMPRKKETTSLGRQHGQHPNTTQQLLDIAWHHCGAIQDTIDRLNDAGTNTESRRLLANRRATEAGKFFEVSTNPVERRELKEIERKWLSLARNCKCNSKEAREPRRSTDASRQKR
jgi:hypothetical protein